LTAAEDSAVRAVVAEFVNTWNRHDMKGMHDLDTDDVEWINIVGHHWHGKAEVYKGHDNLHRTIFAKTQNSIETTTVRAIAPDVAIAVVTLIVGPVPTPSGQVLAKMKTRGSFVMVKRGADWKIAHFHNTVVDPEAEKHDPLTWDTTGPGRK
jgi:uncharacterized protein (TIGR02246 family)